MREKSSLFDATKKNRNRIFSSFFFFFALGKAANITQSEKDDARPSSFCRFLLSARLVSFVGRRLCWCRKERERERGNARRHSIHFPPTNIESASRERDDDAVVFSVGLRVRRPGTRGAVGRREAPRTKAARRFGGNNDTTNTTTLAGWSVDQRRALPTRKEDTHDGVKIRRGDFAPVAAGGCVFLRKENHRSLFAVLLLLLSSSRGRRGG